jgi:death on curing protein
LAIENVLYIEYAEAVALHFEIMFNFGESRIGVVEPNLIESALARPKHAAAYENADFIRQAATLLFGLIKNHPWHGGNKRTATGLTDSFLHRNGFNLKAELEEVIELALNIKADVWKVDEIENWLRTKVEKVGK